MLKLGPPFKDLSSISFFSHVHVTQMTGLIFKRFSDSWFQELTALYFVCQKSRRVCALLCFCLQTLSQHAKIVAFEMASKVLEGRRNIFGHLGNVRKSLERLGKLR